MEENLLSTSHKCSCGHDTQEPELRASDIPHAIRHGAILGAIAGLRPGASLVLVAHHDPVPLLAQVKAQEADAVCIDYVERGPDEWKLRFARC